MAEDKSKELTERHIYEGYSGGTFYSLGPLSSFLNRIGSRQVTSPKGYGDVEGGNAVWLTPEGVSVLYAFWRVPEEFKLSSNPHMGGTKWPGMAKVIAFGLEAKLEAFDAQVKQEVARFEH